MPLYSLHFSPLPLTINSHKANLYQLWIKMSPTFLNLCWKISTLHAKMDVTLIPCSVLCSKKYPFRRYDGINGYLSNSPRTHLRRSCPLQGTPVSNQLVSLPGGKQHQRVRGRGIPIIATPVLLCFVIGLLFSTVFVYLCPNCLAVTGRSLLFFSMTEGVS